MKGNPPVAGGSLKSKPTWSNTFGVFHHVGFFFEPWEDRGDGS